MVLRVRAGDEDVERALADFRKQNWSDCKKSERNGLTCFVCGDFADGGRQEKGGIRREQCMFVSDSTVDDPMAATHHLTYAMAEGESFNWQNNGAGVDDYIGQSEARDKGVGNNTASAAASSSELASIKEQPHSGNSAEFIKVLDEDVFHGSDDDDDDDNSARWTMSSNNSPTVLKKNSGGGGNKKNKVKLNRKIVIKKRKLKQQQGDYSDSDDVALNPAPGTSSPVPVTRTIRKKVTYRKTISSVADSAPLAAKDESNVSEEVDEDVLPSGWA